MFKIEKDDDFFMKGTIDNAYIFVFFQIKKIYIQRPKRSTLKGIIK
jgi:hypothetical protein